MQTIFEKCPLKGNDKLSKLFCRVPQGLHLPAVSDTPRNKILRGIKPRGTTFKYQYIREFKTGFKNILGCEFGDYMG
jgi:hypothetical protein